MSREYNQFMSLVSSPLMNLDHTKRYSGTKLVEEETLSQHIIDTIMMGLKVVDRVNHIAGKVVVDPSTYVMKAVYHDMEEVITGDIPRPLKYYNEDTKNSLKDVADLIAKKFFRDQFSDGYPHYILWNESKSGPEGYILKLVDILVVAYKVVKEVQIFNNFYMLRVAYEVSQYLKEISNVSFFEEDPVNDYLTLIVLDAIDTMQDILDEHQDILSAMEFIKSSMNGDSKS